ncbi:transglycosylase SLT domain-containing protein, partial [Weissella viridescens]
SMIEKVLRQIATESGGNPKVTQGGADPDGDSSGPAMGLMQTKRATFLANAFPGHHDIFNGYDSLLAGLHYAKGRYGSDLSFLGNGHGYANGGLITKHQIAEIGEGNKPEMIIPLDSMKSSRGFELLGKTAAAMAARDQIGMSNASSDTAVSDLNKKFDKMLNYLSSIAENTGKESVSRTYVDRNELWQKQSSDKQLFERQNLNFT